MTVRADDEIPQIPRRVKERLENYRFWSSALVILLILLGVVSVASALIAATFTDALKDGIWLKILTFTSALSSTLINAFNLQGRTSNVWSAFRYLEQAILEYEEKSPDIDKLLTAYREAENGVGFVEFNRNDSRD